MAVGRELSGLVFRRLEKRSLCHPPTRKEAQGVPTGGLEQLEAVMLGQAAPLQAEPQFSCLRLRNTDSGNCLSVTPLAAPLTTFVRERGGNVWHRARIKPVQSLGLALQRHDG